MEKKIPHTTSFRAATMDYGWWTQSVLASDFFEERWGMGESFGAPSKKYVSIGRVLEPELIITRCA